MIGKIFEREKLTRTLPTTLSILKLLSNVFQLQTIISGGINGLTSMIKPFIDEESLQKRVV